MSNVPDSGWVVALSKIEPWLSAALASASWLIFTLSFLDIPPFGGIQSYVIQGIAVCGVVCTCLFIFRIAHASIITWKDSRRRKVARKFHRLSDQQKQFLKNAFNSGRRDFQIQARYGQERWIEELRNWNWIEWHSPMIFTSDSPDYYSITEDAWRQLESSL